LGLADLLANFSVGTAKRKSERDNASIIFRIHRGADDIAIAVA
jgi:hypothetical protein